MAQAQLEAHQEEEEVTTLPKSKMLCLEGRSYSGFFVKNLHLKRLPQIIQIQPLSEYVHICLKRRHQPLPHHRTLTAMLGFLHFII